MSSNTFESDIKRIGSEGDILAGRYRVVRNIGLGSMGPVALAEDISLGGKTVVIKMLPQVLVANKRAYLQIKDVAMSAMKLVHPNIARLCAFEENGGNPFLVTEYVDGQTLDDYIVEKGKLSEDETVRILGPIAAAIDYAHSKGIVHRDVKPGCVVIAKDGRPLISDFCMAREMQETVTRVIGRLSIGTILYMSPEQLGGAAPEPAQDVYSFAAMAYECLKGEPPFVRGRVEHQINNKAPEPLEGTRLGASIMSGLAKKPDDRPPTCARVLEPERAPAERAEGSTTGVERRKPGVAGRLLAVAASLVVVAGMAYYGWTRHCEIVQVHKKELAALKAEKAAVEAAKHGADVRLSELERAKSIAAEESERLIAEIKTDEGKMAILIEQLRLDARKAKKEAADMTRQWKEAMQRAMKAEEELKVAVEARQRAEKEVADGRKALEMLKHQNEKTSAEIKKIESTRLFLEIFSANKQSLSADYSEAVRLFKDDNIDDKDAKVQNYVGWMYENGIGVATNYEYAVQWYRKAAEQGNSDAQYHLGAMLENGRGITKKDYGEARRWYGKAAIQGNADAQNMLGYMYRDGNGVAKNYAEALKWYRRAAEQENANAQNNIGYLYENGLGVAKDIDTALEWYRKAEKNGDSDAKNRIKALEQSR